MSKNFIELNGKRYDAVTGKLITTAAHTATPAPQPKASSPAKITTPAPAPKKRISRDHHIQAKKATPTRKTQPAKTLMRRAVNKPSQVKKPALKQQYPITAKNSARLVEMKRSVQQVDGERSKRAQNIHKSNLVSRFNPRSAAQITTTTHAKLTPQVKPLPLAAHPAKKTTNLTPATQKQKPKKKQDIFERALANAKGHEQPAHKVKKRRSKAMRRMLSAVAGVSAVLLIAGFAAYLNKSSIEMQVASVRAGFQASVPTYQPSGFKYQATNAERGKVTLSFVSPADQRNFTLTQQTSRWDSQTLFDSIVAHSNSSYQTIRSHGRTIYIYDDNKAAWVDGGILYTVSGNANLDSDQIISLASSI